MQGDRRALGAGMDLKAFDVDNKYGQLALSRCYNDFLDKAPPMKGVQAPSVPGFRHFGDHALNLLKSVGPIILGFMGLRVSRISLGF